MSSPGGGEVTSSTEVERKYDVDNAHARPDPSTVTPIGETKVHNLVATYLDTADFTLLRNKITLRRRTGGDDAGWHLKRPGGQDARTELHAPLLDEDQVPTVDEIGSDTDLEPIAIPPRLREQIADLIEDDQLHVVATLTTQRRELALLGPTGGLAGTFCDDLVRADVRSPKTGERAHNTWREWEVELAGEGDQTLLDTVEEHLLSVGGRPAGRASKLGRALEPVLD